MTPNQKLAIKKSIFPFLLIVTVVAGLIVYLVNVSVEREIRAAVLGAITAQTLSFLPMQDCDTLKGESLEVIDDCRIKNIAANNVVKLSEFQELKGVIIASNSYTMLHIYNEEQFEATYKLTTSLIENILEKEPNASMLDTDYLKLTKLLKDKASTGIVIVKLQSGLLGFFVASLFLFGGIYQRNLRHIERSIIKDTNKISFDE